MKERMKPYVGVSGVVNPDQQRDYTNLVSDDLEAANRFLAIGVKATHKPQYDDVANKYGRLWYPVGDEISTATEVTPNNLIIAQMFLEPDILDEDPLYPARFINKVKDRFNTNLDAVQIDMLRFESNPERYLNVTKALAETGLIRIMQCHGYAMAEGPDRAIDAVKRLGGDEGFEYILFDASHGRGHAMDPEALLPFLDAAYSDADFESQQTNFGVAGGLDAQRVVEFLPGIVSEFPEVSWDAEGMLHDKITDGGDGSLNRDKVRGYLIESLRILESSR